MALSINNRSLTVVGFIDYENAISNSINSGFLVLGNIVTGVYGSGLTVLVSILFEV